MVGNSLAIYISSFVECPILWPIIHLYYWVSSTYSCVGIKKVFLFFYIKKNFKKVLIFMIQSISMCMCMCVWLVTYMYYVGDLCLLQVNKNSESSSQHSMGLFLDFSILDCFSVSILYHWPICWSRSTS